MSRFPYISSLNESWQELVDWDDELYDPLFQGETSYTRAQEGSYVAGHQLSESYTSEPTYLVSAPPSVVDEPPSLEYTVSGPPSILDGQSSFEHANGTSLSFDTISTSPLAVQADSQYFGSFGACDSSLLSPLGAINDSPILDTRYDRIPETFTPGSLESTTETVFNPYVTDSSHSFSGLDVRASRLFSNLGTWADQPRMMGAEQKSSRLPFQILFRRTTIRHCRLIDDQMANMSYTIAAEPSPFLMLHLDLPTTTTEHQPLHQYEDLLLYSQYRQ